MPARSRRRSSWSAWHEQREVRAQRLSGGQQRRLDVGLALIGDPELVFLDEPTTGFDPSARHHAWEVIGNLRELGKTVFLTTHYMEEAQALADRVAVIAAGQHRLRGNARDARRARQGAERHLVQPADGGRALRAAARAGIGRRAARGPDPPAKPAPCPHPLMCSRAGPGSRLRPGGPDGRKANPRGRLSASSPRAASGGRDRPHLLASQFRCRPEDLLAQSAVALLHVLLPIVFLVIFAAIFKGTTLVDGKPMEITTYYVPGDHDAGDHLGQLRQPDPGDRRPARGGVLKRARATPVPASVVITSRAAVGVIVALVMSALLLVIGRVAYGVQIPGSTMPGLIIAVIVGAAAFCCLGFAVSTRISAADAAAPVTNLTSCRSTSSPACSCPRTRFPLPARRSPMSSRSATSRVALLTPFIHTHGAGHRGGGSLDRRRLGGCRRSRSPRAAFQWSPRTA